MTLSNLADGEPQEQEHKIHFVHLKTIVDEFYAQMLKHEKGIIVLNICFAFR